MLKVDYSTSWLFPHADGLLLIEALKKAHLYKKDYQADFPTVSTLPPVEFQFISEEQYLAWQVQELITV